MQLGTCTLRAAPGQVSADVGAQDVGQHVAEGMLQAALAHRRYVLQRVCPDQEVLCCQHLQANVYVLQVEPSCVLRTQVVSKQTACIWLAGISCCLRPTEGPDAHTWKPGASRQSCELLTLRASVIGPAGSDCCCTQRVQTTAEGCAPALCCWRVGARSADPHTAAAVQHGRSASRSSRAHPPPAAVQGQASHRG